MEKRLWNTFQTAEQKIKCIQRLAGMLSAAIRLGILLFYYLQNDRSGLHMLGTDWILLAVLAVDILMRVTIKKFRFTSAFIVMEVFLIQTNSYHAPNLVYMELPFIVLSLMENSYYLPPRTAMLTNAFIGLIWAPAVSNSYQMYIGDPGNGFARYAIACFHLSLGAATILSFVRSISIQKQNNLYEARKQEMTVYRNLDHVNHTLLSEMFAIKATSEQTARKEVTKYVHDNVGYVLTNLGMMLEATNVINQADPEQGQEMIARCLQYSHEGLDEIRLFLRNLQQDSHIKINIHREINRLAILFEKCTGTEVITEFGNWPSSFTKSMNSFLISFVKECLTNAVKHGMASRVVISCSVQSKYRIGIAISSNGKVPTETPKYGFGLQSIDDAAQSLGGSLKVACKGGSFVVSVSLPYVSIWKDGHMKAPAS